MNSDPSSSKVLVSRLSTIYFIYHSVFTWASQSYVTRLHSPYGCPYSLLAGYMFILMLTHVYVLILPNKYLVINQWRDLIV